MRTVFFIFLFKEKFMSKFNIFWIIIIVVSVNLVFASEDLVFPLGDIKIAIDPFPKNVSKSTKEISGQDLHILCFDENTLYVWQNEMVFNKLSYGKLNDTDKISITDGTVFVNNKPKSGAPVSEAMQMFLDQSEDFAIQKMGSHFVAVHTISAISMYTMTNENNLERHDFITGDKTIVIENDTLYVNSICYGKIPEFSGIVLNDDGIFINGVKSEPEN